MTFLCILCALLIEQIRPLQTDNPIYSGVKSLAVRFERGFNADRIAHGRLAWLGMVALLVLPVMLVHWLAWRLSPFAAFAWNVLVLYLTVGFRHYSHHFSSIQFAMNTGDMQTARALLKEWAGQETAQLSTQQLFRLAIEKAFLTSHREVFGVFFWFLLPIGPAGAVLYRVSAYLARAWNEPAGLQQGVFGHFAVRAFYWIDWIPVRLTASAFAVVGNFEEALYAWRKHATRHQPPSGAGILLAAGGGAMGVNLEPATVQPPDVLPLAALQDVDIAEVNADEAAMQSKGKNDSEHVENLNTAWPEDAPTLRSLQSTVGLILRALVLWLLLLLLLSLAASLG